MPFQDQSGRRANATITVGNGVVIESHDLKLSHDISGFNFKESKLGWGAPTALKVTISLTNPSDGYSSVNMEGTFKAPDLYRDDTAVHGGEIIRIDPHLLRTEGEGTVTFTPTCLISFGKTRLADQSRISVDTRSKFSDYCTKVCSRESAAELKRWLSGLETESKGATSSYGMWRLKVLGLAKTAAEQLGLGLNVELHDDLRTELDDEVAGWTISRA